MKFKKILFALANLSMITSPIIGITACTPGTSPTVSDDERIDISEMSDVRPYIDQINAANFTAVTPNEILHIFYDAVELKLELYTSIPDLTEGTDYAIFVKTGIGSTLPVINDLTSLVNAARTFQVQVKSGEESTLIIGETDTLTVTLPIELPKQNVNQITNITIATTDYPGNISNPGLATALQITRLIESKVQDLIIALTGAAATASEGPDYYVLVATTTNTPLTDTYNLTQGGQDFNVTITANTSSRKLTGSSGPFAVNFPQSP